MPESTLTHADLVRRAASWLRNRKNCRVVLTEQTTGSGEIPDAIGWKFGDTSYLVECKTSRADFFADRGKSFRCDPCEGMGIMRYFMAPQGVLQVDDLREKCDGWGLLEVKGRTVRVLREATEQLKHNRAEEIAQLVQAIAMAQANLKEPFHEWITGPESAYGRGRASQKVIREQMKFRTCHHRMPYRKQITPEDDNTCGNLVANGYSHCSEHGGRTRGDKREMSVIREALEINLQASR